MLSRFPKLSFVSRRTRVCPSHRWITEGKVTAVTLQKCNALFLLRVHGAIHVDIN